MEIPELIERMVCYNAGDPRRVQHALKVWAFARTIARREGLDEKTMEILEAAAVLHDIGIRVSEEKYHSASGKYQELEGPPVAREILREFELSDKFVNRVCWLVGHHHTYGLDAGSDYQILIEADFLVNLYEDSLGPEQARTAMEKYFKTKTGKKILSEMFLPA